MGNGQREPRKKGRNGASEKIIEIDLSDEEIKALNDIFAEFIIRKTKDRSITEEELELIDKIDKELLTPNLRNKLWKMKN